MRQSKRDQADRSSKSDHNRVNTAAGPAPPNDADPAPVDDQAVGDLASTVLAGQIKDWQAGGRSIDGTENDGPKIDEVLDQFDEAWQRGTVPDLNEYLGTETVNSSELVVELILIDLERRWRSASPPATTATRDHPAEPSTGTLDTSAGASTNTQATPLPCRPRIEDYQPYLDKVPISTDELLELATEEYRVRVKWGDRPDHEEYVRRFESGGPELISALTQVDQNLQQSGGALWTHSGRSSRTKSASFSAGHQRRLRDLHVGDELEDFRLLSELGSGAFARVFLAQQQSLHRLVAIKISEGRSNEPPVLSGLSHPNIIRVFDGRKLDGLYLLTMQYVSGGTLQRVIEAVRKRGTESVSGLLLVEIALGEPETRGEDLPRSRRNQTLVQMNWGQAVAWIGAQLADALRYAHDKGTLHRDVKPANILLTSDASPMLADFNLSWSSSLDGEGAADTFGGSLAYMSPEQLEVLLGKRTVDEVTTASDIYSLAIVLWELLTGRHPLRELSGSADQGSTIDRLLQARRQGLSQDALPKDSPAGLRQVLGSCLAPVAKDRRHDAAAMTRALALASLPKVDQLPSTAYRATTAGWSSRLTGQPIVWLIACGLIPNGVMSALNIWANEQVAIANFDRAFFQAVQKPVINLVAYPLGAAVCVWLAWPIIQALSRPADAPRQQAATRLAIINRCLSATTRVALVVFFLWLASGFAFPLWNAAMPSSRIGIQDMLHFLWSQVLCGWVAASLTFLLVTLVNLAVIVPRYLPKEENSGFLLRIERLERSLKWISDGLGLTPLLALLVLSATDRVDRRLYIALALIGCLVHVLTRYLAPSLRARFRAIKTALISTEELMSRIPGNTSGQSAVSQ